MFSKLEKRLFKFLYAFVFLWTAVGSNFAQELPATFDSDDWVIYYSPRVIAHICEEANAQHDYSKLENFSERFVEKVDNELQKYLIENKQDDFSQLFATLVSFCKKDACETSPLKSIIKTCVNRVDGCVLSVDENELDLNDEDLSKGLAIILLLNVPINRLELESDFWNDNFLQDEEERILALKDTTGGRDTTVYVGLTEIRGIDKSVLVFSSYKELVKRKLPLLREDSDRFLETISDKGLACKRILRKGALNRLRDKISNIDEPNNIIVLLEETLLKLEEVEFSETLECGAVHETATLVFLDADSANDLASVLEGLRTFIRLLLPKNQKLSEEAKEFLEGLLSGMSVSRDDRQVVICCSFSFDTLKQGYSLFWENLIPEKL